MSKKNKQINVNNNENQQDVKDHKVLKKVLKFTVLFMLTIVLVISGAAIYAYMSDQIDPDKIYITDLTIGGVKEYVTISDNDKSFKTTVDFLPKNANQLNLTSKIITGGSLIKEIPAVKAGEEFELVFEKDERGITKGGEIEIKFLDSSQSTYAVLKVLIDVGLNSNYINLSTNGNELTENKTDNTFSTSVLTSKNIEYAHVLKINAINDEMFNSYKGNWSESENNYKVSMNRLKKMLLFYDDKDATVQGVSTDKKLIVEEVINNEEKYYLIKFLSPQSSIKPFVLDVYIYKTYNMETIFTQEMANELITAVNGGGITHINYEKLNAFINDYVVNNCSDKVLENFKLFEDTSNGLIDLKTSKTSGKMEEFMQAIKDVVDFALVSKRINITVENIVVDRIDNPYASIVKSFDVLKDINYGIKDIKDIFGLQLQDKDNKADKEILFNDLRKLEIYLCKKTAGETNFDFEFNIGSNNKIQCNRIKDESTGLYTNKDECFDLTKTMTEGVANWNLKTLSPISSSTQYYLVFKYRNNDIAEYTLGGTKYYYNKDGDYWYIFNRYNNPTKVMDTNIDKQLDEKFGDVSAVSEITIDYVKARLDYAITQGRTAQSNIVINNEKEENVFVHYYTSTNGLKIVNHGEHGVYYGERQFSISGQNPDVIIKTLNESDKVEDMEYKKIKWFVPYDDNMLNPNESNTNARRYYFMPTLDTTYTDNKESSTGNNYNPIPKKVRLAEVGKQNTYLVAPSNAGSSSSTNYFMEVGEGDFVLKALNAMMRKDDNGDPIEPIPLYAAIIQTKIDGQPYIKEYKEASNKTEAAEVVYQYIAATDLVNTSGHEIRSDSYIDGGDPDKINSGDPVFKFYVQDKTNNQKFYESSFASEQNYLNLEQTSGKNVGVLYLSNFDLTDEAILSGQYADITSSDNKTVLIDAIDNFANKRLALEYYFDCFYKDRSDNKGFVVSPDRDKPNAIGNSISIEIGYIDTNGATSELKFGISEVETIGSQEEKLPVIQFNITCNGVDDKYNEYLYSIYTEYLNGNIFPPEGNSYIFFTTAKASNIGAFKLVHPAIPPETS